MEGGIIETGGVYNRRTLEAQLMKLNHDNTISIFVSSLTLHIPHV